MSCIVANGYSTRMGYRRSRGKLKDQTFEGEVVKIKFVKKGSLIIMTTISASILNDQKAFETAIKSFLDKLVEVCHIDTKVHAQLDIRLHILDPNEVKLSFEVPKTCVQMENKLSQTDMTTLDIEMKLSFEVPKTCVQMENKLIQTDMTTLDIETMESERNDINISRRNTGAYKRPYGDSGFAYIEIESRMSDLTIEEGKTRSNNQHLLETTKRSESDLRSMTMISLRNLLKSVKLDKFAELCCEKQINGDLFMDMTVEKLKEEPLSLTRFQL